MKSWLRKQVKPFLYSRGWQQTIKPSIICENPNLEILPNLEWIIDRYSQTMSQKGFFIQVGAFDGMSNWDPDRNIVESDGDSVRKLVEKYHWSGIFIEPQKRYFDQLVDNYSGFSELYFENVAIDNKKTRRSFYSVKGDTSLIHQVASFSREHLIKHEVDEEQIICDTVECTTISSLVQKYKVKHVDLLQIDAEGYDLDIIKSIDFSLIQPAIIRFEHLHLSKPMHDHCIDLLMNHGYRFVIGKGDTIACKELS